MAKRKRGQERATKEVADKGKEIVGGLKDPTGNSRSAGDSTNDDAGVNHLKIPFNDKQIVCEKRNGGKSKDEAVSLIFTHGAGGGIENPATKDFVAGFASVTSEAVVCFQGTMNLSHRTKTFHAVIENQGAAAALGGRSMGARAAVIAATECAADQQPEALVLASYPLSAGGNAPAKMKDGQDPRKQILLDLPSNIRVLFVSGSEDNQCDLEELEAVISQMEAPCWLMEVKGADHGMSLKPKAGVQPVRSRIGALAAEWLQNWDESKRCCTVAWSKDDGEVEISEWTAREKEQKPQNKRKKR